MLVVSEAVNHEASVEPPACRVGGPEGFHEITLGDDVLDVGVELLPVLGAGSFAELYAAPSSASPVSQPSSVRVREPAVAAVAVASTALRISGDAGGSLSPDG